MRAPYGVVAEFKATHLLKPGTRVGLAMVKKHATTRDSGDYSPSSRAAAWIPAPESRFFGAFDAVITKGSGRKFVGEHVHLRCAGPGTGFGGGGGAFNCPPSSLYDKGEKKPGNTRALAAWHAPAYETGPDIQSCT